MQDACDKFYERIDIIAYKMPAGRYCETL